MSFSQVRKKKGFKKGTQRWSKRALRGNANGKCKMDLMRGILERRLKLVRG